MPPNTPPPEELDSGLEDMQAISDRFAQTIQDLSSSMGTITKQMQGMAKERQTTNEPTMPLTDFQDRTLRPAQPGDNRSFTPSSPFSTIIEGQSALATGQGLERPDIDAKGYAESASIQLGQELARAFGGGGRLNPFIRKAADAAYSQFSEQQETGGVIDDYITAGQTRQQLAATVQTAKEDGTYTEEMGETVGGIDSQLSQQQWGSARSLFGGTLQSLGELQKGFGTEQTRYTSHIDMDPGGVGDAATSAAAGVSTTKSMTYGDQGSMIGQLIETTNQMQRSFEFPEIKGKAMQDVTDQRRMVQGGIIEGFGRKDYTNIPGLENTQVMAQRQTQLISQREDAKNYDLQKANRAVDVTNAWEAENIAQTNFDTENQRGPSEEADRLRDLLREAQDTRRGAERGYDRVVKSSDENAQSTKNLERLQRSDWSKTLNDQTPASINALRQTGPEGVKQANDMILASTQEYQQQVVQGQRPEMWQDKIDRKAGPVKQGAEEFTAMNLQNLQWALMFGFSGTIFQALSQIPTEATYKSVTPLYQGASNMMGLGGMFNQFTGFGQQAPQIMSQLQMQTSTLQSLQGSRAGAESSVSRALEISRVQPVQFGDAMEVLTAISTYPATRGKAEDPTFQKEMFETVQLLSMLAPEQGTGGALFAIREMLGGQFRSLQMRFNMSPELLAGYAGVTTSELKSKPGDQMLGDMHTALTNLFGGSEILLRRGAQSDVQLENIGDTLTNTIVKPMVSDIQPGLASFVTTMIDTKKVEGTDRDVSNQTLGQLSYLIPEAQGEALEGAALKRSATAFDVEIKANDNVERLSARIEKEQGSDRAEDFRESYDKNIKTLATGTYGTAAGMQAMILTTLNTTLGSVAEPFSTAAGMGNVFQGFMGNLHGRVAGYQTQLSETPEGADGDDERQTLASKFISGFLDDIQGAINTVGTNLNAGPISSAIKKLADTARVGAETMFQPVAEVIMTQTAKTALSLPGMMIGGALSNAGESVLDGGISVFQKLTGADPPLGAEKSFDPRGPLSDLANMGAWGALTQGRRNPLGAARLFGGLSLASTALQADTNMGMAGNAALSAGVLFGPSMVSKQWGKFKESSFISQMGTSGRAVDMARDRAEADIFNARRNRRAIQAAERSTVGTAAERTARTAAVKASIAIEAGTAGGAAAAAVKAQQWTSRQGAMASLLGGTGAKIGVGGLMAAGVGVAAYNAYDMYQNSEQMSGTQKAGGALQTIGGIGAGLGMAGAMGWLGASAPALAMGGPVGWGIAGVGAAAIGAGMLMSNSNDSDEATLEERQERYQLARERMFEGPREELEGKAKNEWQQLEKTYQLDRVIAPEIRDEIRAGQVAQKTFQIQAGEGIYGGLEDIVAKRTVDLDPKEQQAEQEKLAQQWKQAGLQDFIQLAIGKPGSVYEDIDKETGRVEGGARVDNISEDFKKKAEGKLLDAGVVKADIKDAVKALLEGIAEGVKTSEEAKISNPALLKAVGPEVGGAVIQESTFEAIRPIDLPTFTNPQDFIASLPNITAWAQQSKKISSEFGAQSDMMSSDYVGWGGDYKRGRAVKKAYGADLFDRLQKGRVDVSEITGQNKSRAFNALYASGNLEKGKPLAQQLMERQTAVVMENVAKSRESGDRNNLSYWRPSHDIKTEALMGTLDGISSGSVKAADGLAIFLEQLKKIEGITIEKSKSSDTASDIRAGQPTPEEAAKIKEQKTVTEQLAEERGTIQKEADKRVPLFNKDGAKDRIQFSRGAIKDQNRIANEIIDAEQDPERQKKLMKGLANNDFSEYTTEEAKKILKGSGDIPERIKDKSWQKEYREKRKEFENEGDMFDALSGDGLGSTGSKKQKDVIAEVSPFSDKFLKNLGQKDIPVDDSLDKVMLGDATHQMIDAEFTSAEKAQMDLTAKATRQAVVPNLLKKAQDRDRSSTGQQPFNLSEAIFPGTKLPGTQQPSPMDFGYNRPEPEKGVQARGPHTNYKGPVYGNVVQKPRLRTGMREGETYYGALGRERGISVTAPGETLPESYMERMMNATDSPIEMTDADGEPIRYRSRARKGEDGDGIAYGSPEEKAQAEKMNKGFALYKAIGAEPKLGTGTDEGTKVHYEKQMEVYRAKKAAYIEGQKSDYPENYTTPAPKIDEQTAVLGGLLKGGRERYQESKAQAKAGGGFGPMIDTRLSKGQQQIVDDAPQAQKNGVAGEMGYSNLATAALMRSNDHKLDSWTDEDYGRYAQGGFNAQTYTDINTEKWDAKFKEKNLGTTVEAFMSGKGDLAPQKQWDAREKRKAGEYFNQTEGTPLIPFKLPEEKDSYKGMGSLAFAPPKSHPLSYPGIMPGAKGTVMPGAGDDFGGNDIKNIKKALRGTTENTKGQTVNQYGTTFDMSPSLNKATEAATEKKVTDASRVVITTNGVDVNHTG